MRKLKRRVFQPPGSTTEPGYCASHQTPPRVTEFNEIAQEEESLHWGKLLKWAPLTLMEAMARRKH